MSRIASILLGLTLTNCMPRNPQVAISTPHGEIVAEIFTRQAPISAAAFMHNVDQDIYTDGRATFYRVVRLDNQPHNDVKIEVIQGGVDRDTGDTRVPFIPHETTAITRLTHRDGSLSLARMEPGTANSEFSICIGDQAQLDFGGRRNPDGQGFAVFGQVIKGMDIVRHIQQLQDEEQFLRQPVPFTIRRTQR